jgi:hypothetical protein
MTSAEMQGKEGQEFFFLFRFAILDYPRQFTQAVPPQLGGVGVGTIVTAVGFCRSRVEMARTLASSATGQTKSNSVLFA